MLLTHGQNKGSDLKHTFRLSGVVEIIVMSETFVHTCSLGLDRIMKRRVRMGSEHFLNCCCNIRGNGITHLTFQRFQLKKPENCKLSYIIQDNRGPAQLNAS